jgi:hypothetical protein
MSDLERELNTARAAFNVARANLKTALHAWKPREGAVDGLIYKAEEYGVEHAVELLKTQPETLGFDGSSAYRPDLTQLLTTAYEASHAVDLAMAAREDERAATNPKYVKAVLVADREVEVDVAAGTLYDRVARTTSRETIRRIDSDANYDSDREM